MRKAKNGALVDISPKSARSCEEFLFWLLLSLFAFSFAFKKAFSAFVRSRNVLIRSCSPFFIAVFCAYLDTHVVVFSKTSQKFGSVGMPSSRLLQHDKTALPASLAATKSAVIMADLGQVIMTSSFLISLAVQT